MRSAVLSFTMLTALAVTPALAQMQQGAGPGYMNQNGEAPTGELPAPPSHQPMSRRATNITSADTRSQISPSLPAPPVGPNATATQYLRAASDALARNRTGETQAALENAETFLLNRSVPQGAVGQPDQNPAVQDINGALQALSGRDHARAMELIRQAIPAAQRTEQMAMGGGGGMMQGGNGYQPGMQPNGYQPGMQPNGYQPGNGGYGYQPGGNVGAYPGAPAMNGGYQGGYPAPPPGYGGQPPVR